MIAYKLFRIKSNGGITSLFINKSVELPIGVWLTAGNHPTKGYKERPFWHCTSSPIAPHLSTKNRKWFEVDINGYREFVRPKSQGEVWYLADEIKIIKECD